MDQLGKLIAVLGLALTVLGLLIWGLAKTGFRGLPGDIDSRSENFRFYFPVVTCLVISIVVTALIWIWTRIRRG